MVSPELKTLIQLLTRLPGLGPRSGRRLALHLIQHRQELMKPLAAALNQAADRIVVCRVCGHLDTTNPCSICTDVTRDACHLCVVEGVADLWALERTNFFKGQYHILGGTLSALEGVGPDQLRLPQLLERITHSQIQEVTLALNMTVEGQTTAHYLAEKLKKTGVSVSMLAHGVPFGGELDYLDEGTLSTALKGRRLL